MFRFTIRDVLWLMVVVVCNPAHAQTRTLKNGERVYVRYLTIEGYGVVKGSDSFSYQVELERPHPFRRVTERYPRDSVYESLEHANKRQLPQDDSPPPLDLGPLYRAIGAATCPCAMFLLFAWGVVYVVRNRFKTPPQPPTWPPPSPS